LVGTGEPRLSHESTNSNPRMLFESPNGSSEEKKVEEKLVLVEERKSSEFSSEPESDSSEDQSDYE